MSIPVFPFGSFMWAKFREGGGHSYQSVMFIRLDHNTNRDIAATDVIETIGLLTYDDAHH